eukprot:TRINITY_DN61625_c0_g1_i1.p1 TRINITY_DN61625_c0_g1~~TRINITY_DN61625_c0_g1_i1.p1  ORF type:complete len:354 (-),score=32.29 TRINITY_DN61625_c0_g1_i1:39-1040(-)
MASVTAGLPFVAGAIFCWGTALIFLKFRCVVRRKIPGEVMVLYYALGYFLASSASAGLLLLSGHTLSINAAGIFGGSLWGVGKVLTIFAVIGALGLATSQSIQCAANVLTNVVANALIRRELLWEQVGGVCLLLLGLVTVTLARMETSKPYKTSLHSQDAENAASELMMTGASVTLVSSDPSWVSDVVIGVVLAIGSGIFMGVQAVPFRLCEGSDPLEYVINEGIGQFLVTMLSCGGVVLRRWRQKTLSDLSWRQGVPAGFVGGALAFAAAAFNTKAVAEMGLLAGCLSQLNMVVAGLWGIVLFREIHAVLSIAVFFLGVAFAFGGAALVTPK